MEGGSWRSCASWTERTKGTERVRLKIRNARIFFIHYFAHGKIMKTQMHKTSREDSGSVCRGLLTKNQTTRIGAFLKSCQMRKKSSVSPPNLIGEKRSHDFAAGGSWHAERALAAAAARIHSYSFIRTTNRPQCKTRLWDIMYLRLFISETGLQIDGSKCHQISSSMLAINADKDLQSFITPTRGRRKRRRRMVESALQGAANPRAPGCENALGKFRQKW